MLYPFSALLARMKYITRWSLMHSTRAESLSEHTCDTALLAHLLCLIAKHYTGTPCRPEVVAVAALYHDAPEIITGDMPTPVKYYNGALRKAYAEVEAVARDRLLALLPADLQPVYDPLLSEGRTGSPEDQALIPLVKAADKLSALIKCVEERRMGNTEFVQAEAAMRESLRQMALPEVACFLSEFLPSYSLSLDEQE